MLWTIKTHSQPHGSRIITNLSKMNQSHPFLDQCPNIQNADKSALEPENRQTYQSRTLLDSFYLNY